MNKKEKKFLRKLFESAIEQKNEILNEEKVVINNKLLASVGIIKRDINKKERALIENKELNLYEVMFITEDNKEKILVVLAESVDDVEGKIMQENSSCEILAIEQVG
jgi:hypothetical protein